MITALRWRVVDRAVGTRWRGPLGMAPAIGRDPELPVAVIIGPPGPPGANGPPGAPLRIDAPLAGTWVLPHPLGRIPAVQIALATGESVIADVSATFTAVTVVFSAPQQGFALLS